jgi:hypothetical protein
MTKHVIVSEERADKSVHLADADTRYKRTAILKPMRLISMNPWLVEHVNTVGTVVLTTYHTYWSSAEEQGLKWVETGEPL